MSDAEKSPAKKSARKPQNPAREWIIRGVVFGTLGLLLVLALLDFRAKQAATNTSKAWRAALTAVGEHEELTKSKFEQIPIQGSPVVTTVNSDRRQLVMSINTYVWNGVFRSYTVKVHFGMGNNPSVENIEGPGEPGDQAE